MNCARVSCTGVLALAATVGLAAQNPPPPAQRPSVQAPLTGQGQIIQQIIVKVNGEIFTKTELEQRQIQALQDQNKLIQSPQDLQNDASIRAALITITPDILVQMVDEMLLVQRAHELGYKLSDENFRQIVENIKRDNKLDDTGLRAALQQQGLTFEEFRQNIERSVLGRQVLQDIVQRLALTEQEAHDYYDKHHDEFMTEPSVRLREILIAVPAQAAQAGGFNAGVDAAAAEKAKAIRDRAVAGEDFVKLVQEVSDSPSKGADGLITPDVKLSDMDQKFRDVIEKMKPGEITEPLRTSRGYQLFKVEAAMTAQLQPFDKVRDEIAQHVYSARLDSERGKFLQHLRAQALIEWKNEEMRKMYEKRIAELKSAG